MTMTDSIRSRTFRQIRAALLTSLSAATILCLWTAPDARAELVREGHVQVELVSENRSIKSGQPFWVALRLVMDDGWHVNWRNAGDAGLPPQIAWDLPQGFSAENIVWPLPERLPLGPLMGFGYEHEVLLPVRIIPPEDLAGGSTIELTAKADWLVCREVCIPGRRDVTLSLTVSTDMPVFDTLWLMQLTDIRSNVPATTSDWDVRAHLEDREIVFQITAPAWWNDTLADVFFFPYETEVIDNPAPQILTRSGNLFTLRVSVPRNLEEMPQRIEGILSSATGWRGTGSAEAIEVLIPITKPGEASAARIQNTGGSLWQALLFALMGGMILNLMPCVLPVLSLKVLSLVESAGIDQRTRSMHGILFGLGVLVSFWILAGGLFILRAAGNQLGWGFQLQSPLFVMILAIFFFLLGLSMLGLFEIGAGLTGTGAAAASGGGKMSAFVGGITAAVVATPCTAPFMGSALGFALTQPPIAGLSVFTALGLGMALPYVVLATSPALLRFVPRPGAWMETLKHVMGFMLLATVVWLAWVLGNQVGPQGLTILLAVLLFASLAGWIYGRWSTPVQSSGTRMMTRVIAVAILLGGTGLGLAGIRVFAAVGSEGQTSGRVTQGSIVWHPYSESLLDSLQKTNQPILIDFTADWCLSCKVNELIAFGSADVQEALLARGVVTLRADWTKRNDVITRALARYGRSSVPLYILFSGQSNAEPIILPEILTPGIVLNALSEL